MEDLYPESREDYDKLLTWCLDAFLAAVGARQPYEPFWDRADKHYETYIKRDGKDWRSKVFMPEIFQQIETIKPRLISNLPRFVVEPVGEEDVSGAKILDQLIEWAKKSSKLHLEMAKAFHPTLLYGTGILKVFPGTQYAFGSRMVPVFQKETQLVRTPLIDPETQRQMIDLDGNPSFTEEEVSVEVPVGMRAEPQRYVTYDGPSAVCVDVKNFWPAPESTDVQGARYVIHRTFKDFTDVLALVKEGVYRLPDDFSEADFFSSAHEDPRLTRLADIDKGSGTDPTRKQVEILEIWTRDGSGSPGRVITIANRRAILRVNKNPFWHGKKPFIRLCDYMLPHRFWGIGEVQAMEGIADAINAIVNQRIDAGRLTLDPMYAVNNQQLVDIRDLKVRPGGAVRVKGDGMRPEEVLSPLNRGGVPEHAFREVAELQHMGERVTAVSSYQQGVDTPAQADTATGAAIMQEAGASRFGLKMAIFEIDPFEDLAMMYGSILQQFTTTERVVRLTGEEGGLHWERIDPSSLQGNFDYLVESSTAEQSETVKISQAMEVFREVAQAAQMGVVPPTAVQAAFKDLLEARGIKDISRYFPEQQALMPGESPGMPGQAQPPGQEQVPPEIAQMLQGQ